MPDAGPEAHYFYPCALRLRVAVSDRTERRNHSSPYGSSYTSWWATLELKPEQNTSDCPAFLVFEVGGHEVTSNRVPPVASVHILLPGGNRFKVHETPSADGGSADSDASSRHLRIIEAFHRIDVNGDGTLSRLEVVDACRASEEVRALLGLPRFLATPEDHAAFDRMFASLDADGSDEADVAEFLKIFGRPANAVQEGRMQLATLLVAMGFTGIAPHVDALVEQIAQAAAMGRLPNTVEKS